MAIENIMESYEYYDKKHIRTSHRVYTSVTSNGVKRTPPLDADKNDDDLQSRGIEFVDTDAKNFSDVTPEEVSDYYKSLGEWQNVLPKTDYTYSPASRYYTKKINGRIPIIPNMSRRNIWKVNGELGELGDNAMNAYLARNYEITRSLRIVRQITTVTKTVRNVVRSVYEATRTSVEATGTRNLVLAALAVLVYLFVYSNTLEFTYLSGWLKNLVFYWYDLTCSSVTFFISMISGSLASVVGTTVATVGSQKRPAQGNVDAETLKRWFDENSENIAKKVIGSREFIDFIGDRFRRQEQNEKIRFERLMKEYDFDGSPLGEKLRSLETKVTEWRVEDARVFVERVTRIKDEMKTKEVQFRNEIMLVLASLMDVDSTDDLKNKFVSLFRLVDEAHRKVDQLAQDFRNYSANVSENTRDTERLRDELNYDLKLSIEQMVAQRLTEWKRSMVEKSVKIDKIDVVENYVNDAIRKALEVYNADKTGRPDFALESQGGIILSTRCTETKTANAQFSIFGIPLWHASRSPRTVIQPGVHPGECWAFPGSTGYLVIQLSERILITGFTMEHIPRSLAANGTIDSAPKDFSVWALQWESDPEPRFLGEFRYDDGGDSVQYFEAIRLHEPYQIVELKILSNHGKMDYTCLYRFRVHGIPA